MLKRFLGEPLIAIGSATSLIVLLALGIISAHTIGKLITSTGWISHTQEVLSESERLRSALRQAEAGQRGYVLYSDRGELDILHHSEGAVDNAIDSLERLTADNPSQQQRMVGLKNRCRSRLDQLNDGLNDFIVHGVEGLRSHHSSGIQEDTALMELIGDFQEEERSLLESRLHTTDVMSRQSYLWIFLVMAAGVVTALIGGISVNLLFARQRALQRELHHINTSLEEKVQQRTAEVIASNTQLRQQTEQLLDRNQRMRENERRLQEANQELEAFSYSVSHDLRAPLRAIDGFTSLLVKRVGSTLDADANRQLGLIKSSARQMSQLIDDILAFSRIGRQEMTQRMVDLGALASECIETLRSERPDGAIEFTVQQLPPCSGDPAMLRQVLMNLLSNAIKYSRPRTPARIEVGSTTGPIPTAMTAHPSPSAGPEDIGGVHTIYYVRDNGVGFDMAFADKLFGVFQRLHRADQFEGTGVGLAIVSRILARHGGRIWGESVLDQGATFFFTVGPKRS